MLPVFICEDDLKQKEHLETIVRNRIMIEELDMELVLSTVDPVEILDYLKEKPETVGLYFLDVDLKHKISGIALASEIRELSDLAKIVFVTTHSELTYLTFVHKIEAMDYIIKDRPEEIERKVQDCIQVAYKRYLNDQSPEKSIYKVKIEDRILAIPYDEIMFIESSDVAHKLVLHQKNAQLEYYGSLKKIEEEIPHFFRCHRSYLINLENIKELDQSTKEVEMINGELCLVSTRNMKKLVSLLKNRG